MVVDDVTVRFGGLVAVDGVSLAAPLGRITGLVGPNGAGKTTIFNVCTGLIRPSGGRVSLFGEDATGWPPHTRAQRGLGRTFQRMELFDSLSVADNVGLGYEARLAGSHPARHIVATRTEREAVAGACEEAMRLCGITPMAGRRAGSLSTGERRLVELARAIAGDFPLLLLDEPSSGLDAGETEAFGEILQSLVGERGTGVLLVEHDMALVARICELVYVLEFGRRIFGGPPGELLQNEAVRDAYLGSGAR